MLNKKPITNEEKIIALKTAVKYWNSGKYEKAVALYKRYGITDAQFSKALVAVMHSKGISDEYCRF